MCSLAKRARGNFLSGIGVGSFAPIGENPHSLTIEDKKPRLFLATEVGERCQLSCRHCVYHTRRDVAPQNLVTRKLEEFFETRTPTWVSFAGKEPTMFPEELVHLAEIAKPKSDLTILMTNGLRLRGELLNRLEQSIGLFDISVDGDKRAHDWMRGEGRFGQVMDRIEKILKRDKVPVAVIATLVHANLDDGRRQVEGISALALYLRSRFGGNRKLSLSVSLYYDKPNHQMLLQEDDLVELAEKLGESGMTSRVLWTANYAFRWPHVARRLGLMGEKICCDQQTAIPFVQHRNVYHILFNLTETLQLGVRVSNRGNIYLGCNHLVLGEEAVLFRIAKLNDLEEVVENLVRGENRFLQKVSFIDPRCEDGCSYFEDCRGGDSLSGVYFKDTPVDPYCPLLQ